MKIKRNLLKQLIAMILVVAMMFSFSSVALAAFEWPSKDETLIYASLGDSMTNGYGLEGYDGESGIMNYGNDVYANQFAAWLAGYEGEIADNQVIFKGDRATVDHRQLAMSGMRAEDLNWILNFDHTDAELAKRAVDSKTDIDSSISYHHWNSWENCGQDANGKYNGNCDNIHPTELMRYRWYHDTEDFGFTAGDYRTWDDLLKPNYRFADGAAEILNTYHDPLDPANGYFTSSYANVTGTNSQTIKQNAIENKRNPNYPEDAEDIGEMAGYVWLQVATEFYQKSVADADIISLALGNTNFGTFMFQSMKEAIGARGAGWTDNRHNEFVDRYKIEDVYYIANFDEEMQKTVEGLLLEIDALIDANFDAEMLPNIAPGHEVDGFATLLDYIKYIVKFCVLSYVVNYIEVIEKILDMNPDADIIQIALMNAYAAADDGSSEGTSMGQLIDMLYDPLNIFIAALPTYLQKDGAYPDATFYFADCGTVQTMTDVFGNDYYKDETGNYVEYPGLDNIGYTVNANSTARQRFVHWIAGYEDCGSYPHVGACYCQHDGCNNNVNGKIDFGEFWKHVLIDVTDPGAHTLNTDYSKAAQNFFGKYDLTFMLDKNNSNSYSTLVQYLEKSEDERWAMWTSTEETSVPSQTKTLNGETKTYNFTYTKADIAFSCEMYLAFEDAVIRAGKSSVSVANLGGYGAFDLSACEDAFAKFYQANNITSMTDKVTFTSYNDVKKLFQSLSDELVKDPKSNIMLAMANRMEIGTGIGGHTSAGGHTAMAETIIDVFEREYTAQDQTEKNFHAIMKERYPNLYEKLMGSDSVSDIDDLDIIIEMLKMSKNAALEGVDLDALEAEIRATLRAYEKAHSEEDVKAAQAAADTLYLKLVALATAVTEQHYVVKDDSYYVSLGDSNVNGYGLGTYEEGTNFGLGQIVEGAAPVELAQKLFGEQGFENRFAQYAQGALRAEDMLSILTGEIVNNDSYWATDVAPYLMVKGDVKATYEKYVEALQKADLISIAIGGGNVTTYVGRQVDALLDGDAKTEVIKPDWVRIGYNDVTLKELDDFLDLMVPLMDAMGMMDQYLPAEMEEKIADPAAFARTILESVIYGFASYNYYYPQVLEALRAINPTAQLLILGMFNPVDDWGTTIIFEGEEQYLNIGGIAGNLMESANLQNLAYALQNKNTSFVDLSDNITFLDAATAKENRLPTFSEYYTSILEGNGKEVHANEDGHAYMLAQMYDAIDGADYDAELTDFGKVIYDGLNGDYLTDAEKLNIIGETYNTLTAEGLLPQYPEIAAIEDIYNFLNGKYLNDAKTVDIVTFVFERIYEDREINGKEAREIARFIYDALNTPDVETFMLRSAPAGKLTAADKVIIIEGVYGILEDNGLLDPYATELAPFVNLYNELTTPESDEALLSDEYVAAIFDLAFSALVDNETFGEAEQQKLAKDIADLILDSEELSAEDKLLIVDMVIKAVGESTISGVIGGAVPALPELEISALKKVQENLEAAGYLTDAQVVEILKKLTGVLDGDTADAELLDEIYLIVAAELSYEERADVFRIIIETLDEEEVIDVKQSIVDVYEEAWKQAEAAGIIGAANLGLDTAADALTKAAAYLNALDFADVDPAYAQVLGDIKIAALNEIAAIGATIEKLQTLLNSKTLTKDNWELMLTLENDLRTHCENAVAFAKMLNRDLTPLVEDGVGQVLAALGIFNEIAVDAYNRLLTIPAEYEAWVDEITAYVDMLDPALGAAVRKFMKEVPADSMAIFFAYGDEAIDVLVKEALATYNDIYEASRYLVTVLWENADVMYEAVKNNEEVKALIAQLHENIENAEAALKWSLDHPFVTAMIAKGLDQGTVLEIVKAELVLAYETIYPVVLSALEDVDPVARQSLELAYETLVEVLCTSGAAAEGYFGWLAEHSEAMGAALLDAFLDNLEELRLVACPIIENYVEQLLGAIMQGYEDLEAWYADALYNATHAEYCICGGEHNYVALGGMLTADSEVEKTYVDLFAEALESGEAEVSVVKPVAGEMFLTAKNAVEYVKANAATIAAADIITYNIDAAGTVLDVLQEVLANYMPGLFESGYVDWTEYADVETIAFAEKVLAEVYALLAEKYDAETIESIGQIVEILVYAAVSYGVETYEALETIAAINPDAQIVVVGMVNPLVGTTVVNNGEAIDLGEIFDYVIEATDLFNEFYAIFSGNVTYVSAAGAETVGEIAPTEIVLGNVNIMDLLVNVVAGAYLTEAGHADVCEALLEAIILDTEHNFGEWVVVEEAKIGWPGLKTRECADCHFVDEEVIPALEGPDTPFIPPLYPEPEYVHFFCDGGENCHCHDFEDLDNTMWYHQGVCYMIEKGHMIGISDTMWGPEQVITRAEIATILWRIAGSETVDFVLDFEDVEADMWYTEAIEWAVSEEIFLGYGDGTFGPNDQITREQMVTVMYRFETENGKTITTDFDMTTLSDADAISEWAVDAMTWAFDCGLILGTDADVPTADALKTATRAEVAMIFYRKLDNLLK